MGATFRPLIDTGYERLKPGPGKSPERVWESQRVRIHRAMIELVAERGFSGLTVRGLTRTSGVSTRAFYSHFANVEECFGSTCDSVMRTALRRLTSPGRSTGRPDEALRGGLRSLMEGIAENPDAARLALVESFDGGPAMLRDMSSSIGSFERWLARTLRPSFGSRPCPRSLARGLAAGVERVARAKVMEDRQGELPGVAEELSDWVLEAHQRCAERLPTEIGAAAPSKVLPPMSVRSGDGRIPEFAEIDGDRGRILAAVAKLAVRGGYWNLTSPKIRTAAGVSRRSFESHYDGVSDCFLDAVEVLAVNAIELATLRATGSANRERAIWRMNIAFCTAAASSPILAQLAFVHILSPGKVGLECRERLITGQALRAGDLHQSQPALGKHIEEAAAAASWRIVEAEIATGRRLKISRLVPVISSITTA
jgi:AcrR family transcriptional regulator